MGTMMTFPETPGAAVAFFAIYAFFGWLVEVAYRSATQRRFVNAGFLFGPFVPLYGMGALLVLALGSLMAGWCFLPSASCSRRWNTSSAS